MKLPFETWLESADAPSEAMVAFRESVTSYKAGAYRAGLLFAYVGTGLWLRHRLIAANCPNGVPTGHWGNIQRDLQDDNKWDAMMFDCTQMRSPGEIFIVDDHLRDEFKYWKNRRNDCAHFKGNIIAASHVESFWLFLQSSIGRWVPNGSAQDLIERFARHFDPNLTRPGSDVRPLAASISHAVTPAKLPDFFNNLNNRLIKLFSTLFITHEDALALIHDALLQEANPTVASASAAWLWDHLDILMEVLRKTPSHVSALSGSPTKIRELWRKHLFKNGHKDLKIVAALIRNNLILKEEISEIFELTLEKIKGDIPNDIDNITLNSQGFWPLFHKYVFVDNNINIFSWANFNAGLITWWIQNNQIDREMVLAICAAFSSQYHPRVLQSALKDMLSTTPAKMVELENAASQAGVTVPGVLK